MARVLSGSVVGPGVHCTAAAGGPVPVMPIALRRGLDRSGVDPPLCSSRACPRGVGGLWGGGGVHHAKHAGTPKSHECSLYLSLSHNVIAITDNNCNNQ